MSTRIFGTEIRFDVPWALALLALVVIAAALEVVRRAATAEEYEIAALRPQ